MSFLRSLWSAETWPLHSAWRGRHDFYDTRPPLEAARILESDHDPEWPDGSPPACLICTPTVRYFQYTSYSNLWPRQCNYFVTFYWTGEDGQTLSVNRGDLRAAFDYLVSEWEEIVVLQQKLRRLIDQFKPSSPIVDPARDLFMQLETPRATALDLANMFSSVLDRLADAEAAADVPVSWAPFGHLDLSPESSVTLSQARRPDSSSHSSNTLSTFAFQVALEMSRTGGTLPRAPHVELLKERTEDAAQKLFFRLTLMRMRLAATDAGNFGPMGAKAAAHVKAVNEAAKWNVTK